MIDHNYVVLRKIGNTTQETLSFLWSFSSESALWYLILFHIIMIIISTSVLTLSHFSCGRQCKQNNYFNITRRKMGNDYHPIKKIVAESRAKKASLRH